MRRPSTAAAVSGTPTAALTARAVRPPRATRGCPPRCAPAAACRPPSRARSTVRARRAFAPRSRPRCARDHAARRAARAGRRPRRVFQPPDERRHAGEPGAREVAADLDLGVGPASSRRSSFRCLRVPYETELLGRSAVARRSGWSDAGSSGSHASVRTARKVPCCPAISRLLANASSSRSHAWSSSDRIHEEALACAGDAREHLPGRGLRDAIGVGAGDGRERQQVLLARGHPRARPRSSVRKTGCVPARSTPQSTKRATFSCPRALPDQRCASRNPSSASRSM